MTQNKLKLVVSTGAGISAESGISTFRDADGLWENHDVMEVASHDGFVRNPALVHQFYNDRRAALATVEPNAAHKILKDLEDYFDVYVITQNVDDLHERAGSTNVLHLHGELMKMRAIDNPSFIRPLPSYDSTTSVDTVVEGHHMRPHIVFFQEAVPMFEPATEIVEKADIFVIIGTSLVVYPAAALVRYVRPGVPVYYIDPNPVTNVPAGVHVIRAKATEGMAQLAEILKGRLKA